MCEPFLNGVAFAQIWTTFFLCQRHTMLDLDFMLDDFTGELLVFLIFFLFVSSFNCFFFEISQPVGRRWCPIGNTNKKMDRKSPEPCSCLHLLLFEHSINCLYKNVTIKCRWSFFYERQSVQKFKFCVRQWFVVIANEKRKKKKTKNLKNNVSNGPCYALTSKEASMWLWSWSLCVWMCVRMRAQHDEYALAHAYKYVRSVNVLMRRNMATSHMTAESATFQNITSFHFFGIQATQTYTDTLPRCWYCVRMTLSNVELFCWHTKDRLHSNAMQIDWHRVLWPLLLLCWFYFFLDWFILLTFANVCGHRIAIRL